MEFVLRNWSCVRVSMGDQQQRLFFNVRRLHAKLSRDPSVDYATIRQAIAAATGTSVRDVEIMQARLSGDVALNAPAPWDEDGNAEIGDNLADSASLLADVASDMDGDEREVALQQAMETLDEQERLVLKERWLVNVASLGMLGEFLDITTKTVRRIELAAIAKLQAAVVGRPGGFLLAA